MSETFEIVLLTRQDPTAQANKPILLGEEIRKVSALLDAPVDRWHVSEVDSAIFNKRKLPAALRRYHAQRGNPGPVVLAMRALENGIPVRVSSHGEVTTRAIIKTTDPETLNRLNEAGYDFSYDDSKGNSTTVYVGLANAGEDWANIGRHRLSPARSHYYHCKMTDAPRP